MANENGAWTRQGEVFWRAHHEAWKRSDLNQRQYCEFQAYRRKLSRTGVRSSDAGSSTTQTTLPPPRSKSHP